MFRNLPAVDRHHRPHQRVDGIEAEAAPADPLEAPSGPRSEAAQRAAPRLDELAHDRPRHHRHEADRGRRGNVSAQRSLGSSPERNGRDQGGSTVARGDLQLDEHPIVLDRESQRTERGIAQPSVHGPGDEGEIDVEDQPAQPSRASLKRFGRRAVELEGRGYLGQRKIEGTDDHALGNGSFP